MKLYKFLARGAIGPYSRFEWPTPIGEEVGPWVEVEGELRLASNGIHARRVDQLPYWLEAELWAIEVEEAVEKERHVLARRGRILRRVEAWDAAASADLARLRRAQPGPRSGRARSPRPRLGCRRVRVESGPEGLMTAGYGSATDKTEALGEACLDAGDTGFAVHSGMGTCLAAYLAACSARSASAAVDEASAEADRAERAWQADWLRSALALR